jgi:serine/threonine-protein kinase
MTIAVGTRLGLYEVLSPLGSGGMGEVYRAKDTKLGRDVALKMLPASFTNDPERVARFRREAQVLALLNHPHIGQIYGLEEADGIQFLVLELVDGESLDKRMARGRIPVDEALGIATQIAEALEAAHEKGIIHRDLKPANIALTKDGQVKVLDFGLAKAVETTGGSFDAMNSPTITSPAMMTGVGVILGTAAYMSPEQAKGRAVDKRSDIWAFGCVLYEMLTGKPAFAGEDVSDTLAAVMRSEPDWNALPHDVSSAVRTLLQRSLAKDRRERIADIAAASFVLTPSALTQPGQQTTLDSRRRVPWHRRRAIALAAVVLITAATMGLIVWLGGRSTVERPRVSRLDITPPSTAALSTGVSRDVVMTPDGSRLVYVGANGTALFVRPLDQLEPTAVFRGGAPRDPFVSPDGQWIGFFDGGLTLKRVPITGGPAVLVARLDSFERGATWVGDATIIFATQTSTTGLQRISADGGVPTVLTRPDRARGEAGHAWPERLPGGQAVLYTVMATTGGVDASSIAILDLRSGRSTTLLRGGTHAQYAPSGHVVYAAAGTLRAVGFDSTRLTIVGTATPVVPQVRTTSFGAVDAALARDGTLVYVTGGTGSGTERILVWVDRQGRETPLASPPRAYYFPRVSPDGTHIAVNAVVDQNSDIWVWDLARATLTRLTSDLAVDSYQVWTPDGRRVVFSSNRAGILNLFSQAADGTGAVERLTESSNPQLPSGVSPDGTRVVFTETSQKTGDDVMALPLTGTHQVVPLVQTPFDERNGIVSPDGRWLAYEANDSGAFEIYVRPFPEVTRGHWLVSTGGGTQPVWARSGQELFYFAPDGALMRVAVPGGPAWTPGAPTKVLDGRYVVSTGGNTPGSYDIAPDGQRFLMMKATGSDATGAPPQIVVVQHFDEELKRLVPTK